MMTLALLFALIVPLNLQAQLAPASTSSQALVIEITVPATVDQVWKAFSTVDGLKTWLAPDAAVELRPGGEWSAKFQGGSTGGGTIISFVPEKTRRKRACAGQLSACEGRTYTGKVSLRIARDKHNGAAHADRLEVRA